ncbi:MAG: hypothetical protein [Bacteriophage sp.]|nr:MAG: hypothetical protein [Bacteriophage sp.]
MNIDEIIALLLNGIEIKDIVVKNHIEFNTKIYEGNPDYSIYLNLPFILYLRNNKEDLDIEVNLTIERLYIPSLEFFNMLNLFDIKYLKLLYETKIDYLLQIKPMDSSVDTYVEDPFLTFSPGENYIAEDKNYFMSEGSFYEADDAQLFVRTLVNKIKNDNALLTKFKEAFTKIGINLAI